MRGPVRRKSCPEGALHMMAHRRPSLSRVPGHIGEAPGQPPVLQDLTEAGSVVGQSGT